MMPAMSDEGEARASRARRGLAVYFVLTLVGSGVCEGLILRAHGPIADQTLLVVLLMWSPGLAGIAARLVLREGFSDVSFALRGRHGLRMLALGWLYPIAVGLIAYGGAWLAGIETFAAPERSTVSGPPLVRFAVSLGLNLTLGTLIGAVTAAGEEIGWRGYMLTRLVDARVPRPVLVSGLVWAAWHLPLIVSGQYAAGPYPLLSALMFIPDVVAAGYLTARLRLESGSVWPAVAFHASWNALIQGSFDRYTRGGGASHTTSIWIGESGILVVAVNVALVLLLTWRPWPVRRAPRAEPELGLGAGAA